MNVFADYVIKVIFISIFNIHCREFLWKVVRRQCKLFHVECFIIIATITSHRVVEFLCYRNKSICTRIMFSHRHTHTHVYARVYISQNEFVVDKQTAEILLETNIAGVLSVRLFSVVSKICLFFIRIHSDKRLENTCSVLAWIFYLFFVFFFVKEWRRKYHHGVTFEQYSVFSVWNSCGAKAEDETERIKKYDFAYNCRCAGFYYIC